MSGSGGDNYGGYSTGGGGYDADNYGYNQDTNYPQYMTPDFNR